MLVLPVSVSAPISTSPDASVSTKGPPVKVRMIVTSPPSPVEQPEQDEIERGTPSIVSPVKSEPSAAVLIGRSNSMVTWLTAVTPVSPASTDAAAA